MRGIGYALSSEEHAPAKLVAYAERAEAAGFDFAFVSDHYHPWTSGQGQSGFVWAVLGAIARATSTLRVGTGVTCPIMRIHPAIIAQAAATTAELFEGRFLLGLGAGENLNEHVLGDRWPRVAERHAMIREAVDIIRRLWSGEELSCAGDYFRVDEARLYSLPDELPPLLLAASGPVAAALAGEIADGLIATSPDEELLGAFHATSKKKASYAQVTLCWAASEEEAKRTVHEWWPQTALGGTLSWDLKTPGLVEAACEPLTEEQVVKHIPCGPVAERHLDAIRKYVDAGHDYVYLHQIGPDQEGFFDFFEDEILDRL